MKARALLKPAAASALLLGSQIARPAYADHETRNQVLGETGFDVVLWVLVALVLVGAVVALVAFATVIVLWERRDAEADQRAQSEAAEQEQPAPLV